MSQNKIEKTVLTDQKIRKQISKTDIVWFFRIYFHLYIKHPSAPFHFEILDLLQNDQNPLVSIVAFRGSAKSTLCSLVFPMWAVLGDQQKKHIVIVSQTQQKAQQILTNIKREFENNELLQKDFGPFQSNQDEWTNQSIVIPIFDARISAISVSESVRGIRHGEHRPDLIIFDDIEDIQSTKTKESRDKLWQFVNAELIPAGDLGTRLIFIGNLVHEDSVMMKLKDQILKGKRIGIHKEYPLLTEENEIAWHGKYPSMDAIDKQKKIVGDLNQYLREYLLKIIPDGDQVVPAEWIKSYEDHEIRHEQNFRYYLIAVDPAISQRQTADKTAIVCAQVFGYKDKIKIFILPYVINKRMGMPDTVEEIKALTETLGKTSTTRIVVENVGYQLALVEALEKDGIKAEAINIGGQDKRARLSIASLWIQNQRVVFPQTGVDELIGQIVHFGNERFDDLVDAFTLLTKCVIEDDKPQLRYWTKNNYGGLDMHFYR